MKLCSFYIFKSRYFFVIVLSVSVLFLYYSCYKYLYDNKRSNMLEITNIIEMNISYDIGCNNDNPQQSLLSLDEPSYYRTPKNCSRSNNMKYVLSYFDFWGSLKFDEVFKTCPVNACMMVDNPDFLPVHLYDAIIFDNNKNILPSSRSLFQKYVFFSLESPYNTPNTFINIPNFFNWTMSYRRDSNIHYPYGIIRKQKTNFTLPSLEDIKRKTKMVAWFVSNCQTSGTKRRNAYVEELKKYIQLDIYGACGSLECDKNCYEMVENDYLFYLSFENSMCFDYVTEKVFNVLNYNIIPVVMGYADYDSIVPPKSVINVDSFPTPKHLANYLLKIKYNLHFYLDYMKWKKDYILLNKTERIKYRFCQLCDLLHEPLDYSWYSNIKKWYFGLNCYEYESV